MSTAVAKQKSESVFANPKTFFLSAAFVSFVLSVGLWFDGNHEAGVFVGLWVPSICAAGALILAGGRHE